MSKYADENDEYKSNWQCIWCQRKTYPDNYRFYPVSDYCLREAGVYQNIYGLVCWNCYYKMFDGKPPYRLSNE